MNDREGGAPGSTTTPGNIGVGYPAAWPIKSDRGRLFRNVLKVDHGQDAKLAAIGSGS
jgi:hypothetical protein